MSRKPDLLTYLPPVIRQYKEFQEIASVENEEFQVAFAASEKILNNMFIQDADADGIKRYELILNIRPSKNDTLETRRFRVLFRWNDEIPYTWKAFIAKLDALCGKDNYTVTLQHNTYEIDIETHLSVYGTVDELLHMIHTMIPCNLVVIATNQLYGEVDKPLYLGSKANDNKKFELSSDIRQKWIPSATNHLASIPVKHSRFELSSDFKKIVQKSLNNYTASAMSSASAYVLSSDFKSVEVIPNDIYTSAVLTANMRYELS